MNPVTIIISMLLFFVLFFGIGFLLNMLLRKTWIMAAFYPLIVIFIIDNISTFDYFTKPGQSFEILLDAAQNIKVVDIIILSTGFIGTIIAGLVIRELRKKGYQMF